MEDSINKVPQNRQDLFRVECNKTTEWDLFGFDVTCTCVNFMAPMRRKTMFLTNLGTCSMNLHMGLCKNRILQNPLVDHHLEH